MPRGIPNTNELQLKLQLLAELRQLLGLANAITWPEAQIALKPKIMRLVQTLGVDRPEIMQPGLVETKS